MVGEEYIKSVSKKILNIADKNKIPIICLPGDIPLVDIFEELGHAIAYKDKATANYEDLLAEIVFGTRIDETSLSLKAYFHCNENMKDTAEYIYSHPNTIKYRLQRIEEICGRSLVNSKDKLELQVSLYIMQVLHIGE